MSPRRARNALTAQQVVLHAGEYAAPVTAEDRFINHALDLDVDAIAAEDAIVDSAEQIEQPALIPRCRIGSGGVAPGLGFILRHAA